MLMFEVHYISPRNLFSDLFSSTGGRIAEDGPEVAGNQDVWNRTARSGAHRCVRVARSGWYSNLPSELTHEDRQ